MSLRPAPTGPAIVDRACRRPVKTAARRWFVYILRCADDTLYTGITTDVARRVQEHNAGNVLGARYTAGRLPVVLAYVEENAGRSRAAQREAAIKKLNRGAKLVLCNGVK